jgi:hypothetical protein
VCGSPGRPVRRYLNLSGDSGVTGYELGSDYMLIEFRTGARYRYSYASAGAEHVERMKALAVEGRGLCAYISRHVHDRYDRTP